MVSFLRGGFYIAIVMRGITSRKSMVLLLCVGKIDPCILFQLGDFRMHGLNRKHRVSPTSPFSASPRRLLVSGERISESHFVVLHKLLD